MRAERNLEKVEKLIELFEPFILHNEHDFEADNVEMLSYALVPEEKACVRIRHAIASTGGITGSIFIFRRCAGGLIR